MPVQKMYKQGHGTFDADNVNVKRSASCSQASEHVERSGEMIALYSQYIFTDTIMIGVKTTCQIIFFFCLHILATYSSIVY